MSYSGVGVYVSSALVMCEVPRSPPAAAEESSMYTIGARVALVERVNLDVLNVTTMTPTAASDAGGNAVTITVVGAEARSRTTACRRAIRFHRVAARRPTPDTVSVITPAMKPESSKDVWSPPCRR